MSERPLFWSVARLLGGPWRLRVAFATRETAGMVGASLVARGEYTEHLVIHGTRDEARAKVRELNHDEY